MAQPERKSTTIDTSPAAGSRDLPTLVYLHALGSSREAFADVGALLSGEFDVLGIDLPGFGDEAAKGAATVEETVQFVIAKLAFAAPHRWILVGHSMGGKIASLVASRVLAGTAPLFGLCGVVLLAGSPVSPEPMDEARRAEMLGWAHGSDGGGIGPQDARTFIDANIAGPLAPAADALMLRDLARTAPEAWTAWFNRGSLEDWSATTETMEVPALIVSGREDGDLGEGAQQRLNGALYPRATFAVVDGAAHLLPLEKPTVVADLIRNFWRDEAGTAPVVPRDTAAVIASAHTSARTRGILARRALADDPRYAPQSLTPAALETLRAVADRVVPQDGPRIDLAARVDAQLAAGKGDGWRNADLPADTEAYRLGLQALSGFANLPAPEQDIRLHTLADPHTATADATTSTDGGAEGGDAERGGGGRRVDAPAASRLTPSQLATWFEDARTDLVRIWLAHPASLARVGFDGFATGGDGERKQGFQLLAAGQRETWEPAPQPAPTRGASPSATDPAAGAGASPSAAAPAAATTPLSSTDQAGASA
ncbi:alpha/beta hydrolase [Herbiconiux liukaitaii]|uniref:alpha/beta hydrolase n=1 Tax=Herbiconiux liukaitaii TaxID=3342799 RepID=UPI0035B9383F